MLFFSVIGGIDKIIGNKFGLGAKFEEGFKSMGALALTIIGIFSFSPLIAELVSPVLIPLSGAFEVDSSVFISSILSTDLGAYTTSMEMTQNTLMAQYNSIILGSMLGVTISFTIPFAINLVPKEDIGYLATGILSGLVTIPLGMIAAGLIIGLSINEIMLNLFPVIIFVIFILYGLLKVQDKLIKAFSIFGKFIMGLSSLGLIINVINFTLGIELVQGMLPLDEGVILVASIAIVLSGAYPLLYFISRKGGRILRRIMERYELDEYSILGLVSSLASSIPMFGIFNKMNAKGKVLNSAFAVSGGFTLGGQLGYVSSVAPEFANPLIIGSLVSGISAMGLANFIMRLEEKKETLKPITDLE